MYSSLASSGSILPNILDVAQEHGLSLGNRTSRPDEVRVCCPFCGDSKYHLYLNTDKQVFNCYRCGEKGGVVRFISLLSGEQETEVLCRLKNKTGRKSQAKRKKLHPATSLNTFQLREIGYEARPYWSVFFKETPNLAKEYADNVWQDWQEFLSREKQLALRNLYIALKENKYGEEVEKIKARSKEIGVDLLTPCLNAYSEPFPDKWALEAKDSATMWLAMCVMPDEEPVDSLIEKASMLLEVGYKSLKNLPIAVGIIKRWSKITKTNLLTSSVENLKKTS